MLGAAVLTLVTSLPPKVILKVLILLKYSVHREKHTHLQLDEFSQSELPHVTAKRIKKQKVPITPETSYGLSPLTLPLQRSHYSEFCHHNLNCLLFVVPVNFLLKYNVHVEKYKNRRDAGQ